MVVLGAEQSLRAVEIACAAEEKLSLRKVAAERTGAAAVAVESVRLVADTVPAWVALAFPGALHMLEFDRLDLHFDRAVAVSAAGEAVGPIVPAEALHQSRWMGREGRWAGPKPPVDTAADRSC